MNRIFSWSLMMVPGQRRSSADGFVLAVFALAAHGLQGQPARQGLGRAQAGIHGLADLARPGERVARHEHPSMLGHLQPVDLVLAHALRPRRSSKAERRSRRWRPPRCPPGAPPWRRNRAGSASAVGVGLAQAALDALHPGHLALRSPSPPECARGDQLQPLAARGLELLDLVGAAGGLAPGAPYSQAHPAAPWPRAPWATSMAEKPPR
jgi:hypothetical protein